MINKKDINIDYGIDVNEHFVPINYELWAVTENEEGFTCDKVYGFLKVIESTYLKSNNIELSCDERLERTIAWRPAILEYGEVIAKEGNFELLRHIPSYNEVKEIFSSNSDIGLRSKDNFIWIDKQKNIDEVGKEKSPPLK